MISLGTIVYLHIYHLNNIKHLQVCTNGFLLIIVHGMYHTWISQGCQEVIYISVRVTIIQYTLTSLMSHL